MTPHNKSLQLTTADWVHTHTQRFSANDYIPRGAACNAHHTEAREGGEGPQAS